MASEHYQTHLFSYRFGDAFCTLQIKAKNADEAKERLKALAWATYDGVLVANVPLAPRRIVQLFDWLRWAVPKRTPDSTRKA
jgi:hypothetical protein